MIDKILGAVLVVLSVVLAICAIGGIAGGLGVTLHALGVFTCDTLYCWS